MQYEVHLRELDRLGRRYGMIATDVDSIVRSIGGIGLRAMVNDRDPSLSVASLETRLQSARAEACLLSTGTATDGALMKRSVADAISADQSSLLATSGLTPVERIHDLLVQSGFLPDDAQGGLTWPAYLTGVGLMSADFASSWVATVSKSTFQPRGSSGWLATPAGGWSVAERARFAIDDVPLGRSAELIGSSVRHRTLPTVGAFKRELSTGTRHWRANPHQATNVARWNKVGTWAGRVGGAVTFGLASWSEWSASGADPNLSSANRIGRSAAKGASTAAGAWAGASVGAQFGAVVGTALFPGPGTVVGGFVGGVVGGVAGSVAGEWVGNQIKEGAGSLVDGVASGASVVADSMGNVADALTFWD